MSTINSLNLISEYYSSNSEDDEEENEKYKKIGESLSVPQSILLWKGVPHHEEIIDNPSDHNGKIRTFKHERGNWATLVYVNYTPSDAMLSWIKSITILLPKDSNILFEQFHVSLTRTLILKFHWIESFIESLKKLFQKTNKFTMELTDIKVYCNEERTRTFLGINCYSNVLNYLISTIDNMLTEYQLPSFYEDPSFHISILWWVGDKEDYLNKVLPSIKSSFNKFLIDYTEENYVHINELYCKVGNKLYTFKLQ
ncbi:U6 snRNA phosphodiesterase-like [Vespula squamosa]|uniref:U6 snRNA phosphodiesterase n=1 Tax=Vespula squamosa TaxID=30214 RepID=A0ABD2C6U2_VESSQ